MTNYEVIEGDCREIMRCMKGSSAHAIVTDPPYELSENRLAGRNNCVVGVLKDVVFPYYSDLDIALGGEGELAFPCVGVTLLRDRLRAVRVEPGIGMVEGAINFQSHDVQREVEIKDTCELPTNVTDTELTDKADVQSAQFIGNYVLDLGHFTDTTICDGLCCHSTAHGPELIALEISAVNQLLVPGTHPDAIGTQALKPFGCDSVWLAANAFGQSETSPLVVARGRTELNAILTLNAATATGELRLTDRAGEGFTLTQLGTTQPVGTLPRASGLSSVFKAYTISLVGFPTDGTFTLYLHKKIIARLIERSNRGGFMGKKWDSKGVAYDVDMWRECLRVLKPGGFLVSFSATRTYHRMAVAVEDAGFTIHPMFGILGWMFAQGFPKGVDVSKAIGKKGMSAEEVEKWEGYKYGIQTMKPAFEPILLAQKPYEGKALDSIRKHEVGAFNIDGCRVSVDPVVDASQLRTMNRSKADREDWGMTTVEGDQPQVIRPDGRYPANLLQVHAPGCERVGEQTIKNRSGSVSGEEPSHTGDTNTNCYGEYGRTSFVRYGDDDGNEVIEAWVCQDGCAVRELNLQTVGSGGAARFFTQFYYCAKAAKRERDAGLDGNNKHPTVKPIKLMQWLVRLVSREGQLVLDPFCGSGSTGCAAVIERRKTIGIDLDPESVENAIARIKFWQDDETAQHS